MIKAIDLHTHGIGGYDTRTARVEDILRMAEIHGALGTSAIVPTLYPAPPGEMRAGLEAVKKAMEIQRSTFNVEHSQSAPAAQILGVHLEGPFLNHSRSGALDADHALHPTQYNFTTYTYGFKAVVRIITLYPDLDGARELTYTLAET